MILRDLKQYFEKSEISVKRDSGLYTFIEFQLKEGYWLKIGDAFYNRYEFIEEGFIDIFPEDECEGVITIESLDSELPEWVELSKFERNVVLEG